jgi:hypothetical protein
MQAHHRILFFSAALLAASPLARAEEYILLGWNDLGMHCSNKNFSKVVVLPPFNNVRAQLLRKAEGQSPVVLTAGYTVAYSIPGNTYSVGKTDFWTYAQQLFGLAQPLPPNIGLTGNGLTGMMDTTGNCFLATGIPVTPFPDNDMVSEHPFQLIHLVARAVGDTTILATTDVVIPVSNEVGCVQSGCHSSENNILNSHQDVSGFNRSGPVLCASCHSSNALGTTGDPVARPFSFRIHEKHNFISPSGSMNTCYKCHPGPNTQCLRDVMRNSPSQMVCQNCHGTMSQVAASIDGGRRPWLEEPSCGATLCHGANHAEEPGQLFRQSRGHGGLFCSACHGSPHAITPTSQPNDNLQSLRLQGVAGVLRQCTICHANPPSTGGPHGLGDPTIATVHIPILPAWNMVSVPVTVPDLWTNTVFPTTVSAAYASIPGGGYVLRDTLAYGTGYWLKFSGAEVVTLTGGHRLRDTVNVQTGWNLVGSVTSAIASLSVIQVPGGILASGFYKYGASGYVPSTTIDPGVAYWVKVSAPGQLIMAGSSPPRPPNR